MGEKQIFPEIELFRPIRRTAEFIGHCIDQVLYAPLCQSDHYHRDDDLLSTPVEPVTMLPGMEAYGTPEDSGPTAT